MSALQWLLLLHVYIYYSLKNHFKYTGRRAVAVVRTVLHNRRHGHSIQHSPFVSSNALSTSSVSETTYRPAYRPQIICLEEFRNKLTNDQFEFHTPTKALLYTIKY